MDLLWRGTSVGRETIGDVGGGGSIGYGVTGSGGSDYGVMGSGGSDYGVMGGGGARGGDDRYCSTTFWELLMVRKSIFEIYDTPISLKM